MDVEVKTTQSAWLNCQNLWISCIESNKYDITIRDCPLLSVQAYIAHASPVDKPLIRRRILIATNAINRLSLSSLQSPQLILVTTSCDFKFSSAEADGLFDVGVESWAVLVWSFITVPGAVLTTKPDHCNGIDLPGMPVVNIETSNCSCLGVNSLNSPSTVRLDPPNADTNLSTMQYSTTIPIKGSTYGEEYQRNLKTVQTVLRSKKEVPVTLVKETDNPRDSNAILIEADIDGQVIPLGYVGLQHIPKVTTAMRDNVIVKALVKNVTSWYVKNIGQRKLRGFLLLTKTGSWLPDCSDNVYNSEL